MITRISRDEWGLRLAEVTALRATCARRRAGCILTDVDGHVLATGYNGVAAGQRHCIDAPCPGATLPSGIGLDVCQAIHAEQNALLQCPDVRKIVTCYVTCSPCVHCVKMLMNTGCRRIIFRTEYSDADKAAALWINRNAEENIWHEMGLS